MRGFKGSVFGPTPTACYNQVKETKKFSFFSNYQANNTVCNEVDIFNSTN